WLMSPVERGVSVVSYIGPPIAVPLGPPTLSMMPPGIVLAALPGVPSSNRHQATVEPAISKVGINVAAVMANAQRLVENLLSFIFFRFSFPWKVISPS